MSSKGPEVLDICERRIGRAAALTCTSERVRFTILPRLGARIGHPGLLVQTGLEGPAMGVASLGGAGRTARHNAPTLQKHGQPVGPAAPEESRDNPLG